MTAELRALAREKRVTDYILPNRIVAYEGKVENCESLLWEKPLQIAIIETDIVCVKGAGFIVIDFDRPVRVVSDSFPRIEPQAIKKNTRPLRPFVAAVVAFYVYGFLKFVFPVEKC